MRIRIARDPADLETIRTLFREYALGADAPACFVTFEDEIASLPDAYAPPQGRLYLAGNGEPAGCVALRRLDPRTAEIKRLYVREPWRRSGLGRELALAAIAAARETGAARVVLDTLPSMARAQALYSSLGFHEIPPYLAEPTPGAICFELAL
ncbi:MAG: GNAT family N-acetyltransferase [Betaproteobacteria bacterium]|nr:GNAT family N-acetyltransferase [Betaproteobacteria bacterium]